MTALSPDPELIGLFDRALVHRDAGDYVRASQLLRELVERTGPADARLFAHAHVQLGYMCKEQKRRAQAVTHFRAAVVAAPDLDLASLSLFFALDAIGRQTEALVEAVRLLSLRESLDYRELFAEGFGGNFVGEDRALLQQARDALASHLAAQRARASLSVGDTVRVLAPAPPEARPGSLATVRVLADDDVASVRFADGERVWVSLHFLDHRDLADSCG